MYNFHSACNIKRPIRLKESTRQFAYESLNGLYGDDAMKTPAISMDEIEGFSELSAYEKYDAIIEKIAKEAPIRICENELVCGSATLGWSLNHLIPASYKKGHIFYSVSHVTLDFEKVVKKGINFFDFEINRKLANNYINDEQKIFLSSMKNTIKSMKIWHARYLNDLKIIKPDLHKILKHIPFKPATSFHEALMSLWFCFAFTRLTGNWPGIGRLDFILKDYLEKDLRNNKINLEEAREILASFFIKGCEWIRSDTPLGSGDAQHYQNIVISGIDGEGNDITNDVTYLILDVVEELGISDFPISVRLNEHSPQKLKKRLVEVIRHGNGIIAIYNESLVIRALTKFGYPLSEARHFANDGCWEVQIPGKTNFSYVPFDCLQILQRAIFGNVANIESLKYEDLYSSFKDGLRQMIENIYDEVTKLRFSDFSDNKNWKLFGFQPSSLIGLLTNCVDKAKDYFNGGPENIVISPHIGGAPDTANALYAIKKIVFEEKKATFSELINILSNNWQDHDELRQYVLNSYLYYGNDNDEVDMILAEILDDFACFVNNLNNRCEIKFPAGVSTFGRQIEWAKDRMAMPHGHFKNTILAGNLSPTPGTDLNGVTSIIKSYCKSNMVDLSCGVALDIQLYPSVVDSENGLNALISLMEGFIELDGFFMQPDVIDAKILKLARENPKAYKTLSVRISGWSARFITLDTQWQDMIIERTAKNDL